jgi:hypothetical protein
LGPEKAELDVNMSPSLNHLFVSGVGPPTPAEYEQPGHVDEAVVNDIARWIQSAI